MEGVLTDQTKYYMKSADEISAQMARVAEDLQKTITLKANSTILSPMVLQMQGVQGVRSSLSNTMINVVFFLGVLSIQLIYSLMISDVDEKTYEYGMMRSLGLKSQGLISLVSL